MDEEDPRVDAARGQVLAARQRRVARPAALGRGEEDRAVEDHAARGQEPEGQGVELRERHVPRPDHERHEVVAEPGHDRHDEQEDHRRPVHREELVVRLRVQERVVGLRQLEPHEQRLDPAEHEEGEGQDQVHDPDPLVVGRRDPARPARALAARRRGRRPPAAAWSCARVAVVVAMGEEGPSSYGLRPASTALRWAAAAALAALMSALRRASQRSKAARGDRVDLRDHVRVAAPAELRAVAAEDVAAARPELRRDLEPRVVRVARDGVELAAELRDPPGVGDVLRADVERDGRLRGDDHLRVAEGRVERARSSSPGRRCSARCTAGR